MRILFVAITRMMYIVNVLIFSDNNYNITVVLSGHLDLYTRHLIIVMTLMKLIHINAHVISYLFKSFLSSSATGFRVYLRFAWPSGLPKCDISTTDFAPLSNAYLTESKAATIRWLLVMTPSFKGTLKSTLQLFNQFYFHTDCIPLLYEFFVKLEYKNLPHQHALASQVQGINTEFI